MCARVYLLQCNYVNAGLDVERAEAEARHDFARTNEELLKKKLQHVFAELNGAHQLKFTVRRCWQGAPSVPIYIKVGFPTRHSLQRTDGQRIR